MPIDQSKLLLEDRVPSRGEEHEIAARAAARARELVSLITAKNRQFEATAQTLNQHKAELRGLRQEARQALSTGWA